MLREAMNQMARDRVKKLLPIIQAFSEGKVIQEFNNSKWKDVNELDFLNFFNLGKSPSIYRIKPEPNYIPFINKEECWAEMHKHPDFGWIKNKNTGHYFRIEGICKIDDETVSVLINDSTYTLYEVFNAFTFIDDTPFGTKKNNIL